MEYGHMISYGSCFLSVLLWTTSDTHHKGQRSEKLYLEDHPTDPQWLPGSESPYESLTGVSENGGIPYH